MSTPARVTLVRHGESLSNRGRRLSGQHDVPLTERGQAQAEALAHRLGAVHFDRVISSDLLRARATAEALARPFALDAGFREIDLGGWQGLTPSEVQARFGDQLDRLQAGEDVAIGGGESYLTFCSRVDRALSQLVATLTPGAHALVVCHGAVIGALVSGVLGLRDEATVPIGVPMHTSLTTLEFEQPDRPSLRVFNDASHLGASALDAPTSERIAVRGEPAVIRRWIEGVLWPDASRAVPAALREPPEGALAHVGAIDGRLALLDYGVTV